MKPLAAVILGTLLAGASGACSRTSPPASPVGAELSATMLFCAYGGVGIAPDPLPPGYDTQFAEIVIEVNNPGAALGGVTVASANLLDAQGVHAASMRRVDRFVVLPPLETPGPTLGTFAVYLNPKGTPFTGTLGPGRTQLRVRVSIDRDPSAVPAQCRITLGGPAPKVIEGKVDGSWPT
jgi:hypothetical protein